MTDQPRLWDSLVEQASSGELTVDLDGDTFDAIDQAFDSFLRELRAARTEVRSVAVRGDYGVGNAADVLHTARATVTHLDTKAVGGTNSADTIISEYLGVGERVRAMFQAMRQSYATTESDNSSSILSAERPR